MLTTVPLTSVVSVKEQSWIKPRCDVTSAESFGPGRGGCSLRGFYGGGGGGQLCGGGGN